MMRFVSRWRRPSWVYSRHGGMGMVVLAATNASVAASLPSRSRAQPQDVVVRPPSQLVLAELSLDDPVPLDDHAALPRLPRPRLLPALTARVHCRPVLLKGGAPRAKAVGRGRKKAACTRPESLVVVPRVGVRDLLSRLRLLMSTETFATIPTPREQGARWQGGTGCWFRPSTTPPIDAQHPTRQQTKLPCSTAAGKLLPPRLRFPCSSQLKPPSPPPQLTRQGRAGYMPCRAATRRGHGIPILPGPIQDTLLC